MNLTRRQFGGSVIAATMGSMSSRSVSAQTPGTVIVGVEHGAIIKNLRATAPASDGTNIVTEDYTNLPPPNTPASSFEAVVLWYVNLETGRLTSRIVNQPLLSPGERFTGITYLADGTLLIAITPQSASANGSQPTRLLKLNKTVQTIPVSGLAIEQALDSLLLLQNGSLIGLVTRKDGTGNPAQIVNVNWMTGAVTFSYPVSLLPAERRFSCLAEAPDGTLYTSVFLPSGTTELWKVDLAGQTSALLVDLTVTGMFQPGFDKQAVEGTVSWYHGMQSLIVTPGGGLVALSNLEYRLPGPNGGVGEPGIYGISVGTGLVTEIVAFKSSRATRLTSGSTLWGV